MRTGAAHWTPNHYLPYLMLDTGPKQKGTHGRRPRIALLACAKGMVPNLAYAGSALSLTGDSDLPPRQRGNEGTTFAALNSFLECPVSQAIYHAYCVGPLKGASINDS